MSFAFFMYNSVTLISSSTEKCYFAFFHIHIEDKIFLSFAFFNSAISTILIFLILTDISSLEAS